MFGSTAAQCSGLKTGTLHKETSIFDRSSTKPSVSISDGVLATSRTQSSAQPHTLCLRQGLNDFLESSCLEVESAMRPAPAGKAKAKSKAKARAKSSADPGSIDPEERPSGWGKGVLKLAGSTGATLLEAQACETQGCRTRRGSRRSAESTSRCSGWNCWLLS